MEELTYVLGPNDFGGGMLSLFAFLYPTQLIQSAQGYWTNLARRGDPNGPNLLAWPRYDVSTDRHLVLADPASVGSGLRRTQCDYWDRYLAQH